MPFTYIRRAAVALALLAAAGCTVKNSEAPPLTGPSGLALTLNVNAIPDSISQDGGSQSSIKITAIGPNGKGLASLPLRLDMVVSGVPQDYGTLSARSVVTNSDGVATAVYTAPPSPVNGVFGTCNALPGNCVTIVATPTSTNFTTANPEQVLIRLVPTGVILPPASQPTAAFTFSPTPAVVGVVLNFDASGSTVGSGASQIVSYIWDFGDGTSGTGKNPTHTYSTAATFNVRLTVTNDRSLSASTSQPISVTAPIPTPASVPTPVFTFSPAAPGVNETVFFNGSTSTAGVGHSISSYRWTFGDGATATGATTTHAYATAGTYTAQLTVTDEVGQAVTSSGTTVSVGAPPAPSANFTFSPTTPVAHDNIVFDASSTTTPQGTTITQLAWNFGDGTPIITCPGDASCQGTRIISHAYNSGGNYVVNLVVTDSAGRTASHNTGVSVGSGNPTAALTVAKTGGRNIAADGSQSTSQQGFSIATYRFIWGDGTADTVGNSSSAPHLYTLDGTYTVTLRVTDNAVPARSASSSGVIVTVP